MKVNTIERALYYTRADNNDHDVAGLARHRRPRSDARPARLLRAASAGLALRDPVDALVRVERQGRAGAARASEAAHEALRRGARDQRHEEARRDHEGDLRHRGGRSSRPSASASRSRPSASPRTTWRTSRRRCRTPGSWPTPGPSLPQQYFFTNLTRFDGRPARAGLAFRVGLAACPAQARMLRFIVKRLFWMMPSLFAGQLPRLRADPAAARRLRHDLHRDARGLERDHRPEHGRSRCASASASTSR